ncbi:hypothetical protein BH23THE1_BH23THE1_19490 [soil metagenome]
MNQIGNIVLGLSFIGYIQIELIVINITNSY